MNIVTSKKIVVVIAKVVSFIVCFIGVKVGLNFLVVDDVNSVSRILFHELYQQENIDVLFLGSSHCRMSLIPEELDEVFKGNTFNGGTSSQSMDTSYVILQEVGKHNALNEVYLELYFGVVGGNFKNRTNLTSIYLASDYLKPSLEKIDFLINASSSAHYGNSFLTVRRNIEEMDLVKIYELVHKKFSTGYFQYEYVSNYQGKGFTGTKTSTAKNGIFYEKSGYEALSDTIFTDDYKEYLFRIIQYCQKHNIKLTLYSAPMPDYWLANREYDRYIVQVEELLKETDIPYIDFNLCREEFLTLNSVDDFYDRNHLNYLGAEKFSRVFGEFFVQNNQAHEAVAIEGSSNIYHPKEYFYGSYAEKFTNLEDAVLGIIITEENGFYEIESVVAGEIRPTYEVHLVETQLVVSEGKFVEEEVNLIIPVIEGTFTVPTNYTGNLQIEVSVDGQNIGTYMY